MLPEISNVFNNLEQGFNKKEKPETPLKDVMAFLKENLDTSVFLNKLDIPLADLEPNPWEFSGAANFFNCLIYKNTDTVLRLHLYPGRVKDCHPHCHATQLASIILSGELTQSIYTFDENGPGNVYQCTYTDDSQSILQKVCSGSAALAQTHVFTKGQDYYLPPGDYHTVQTNSLTLTLCCFKGSKVAIPKVITLPEEVIELSRPRALYSQQCPNLMLQRIKLS